MTKIGFHASHEQFSPRELLDYAQLAESVGFDAAMSSEAELTRTDGHTARLRKR